MYTYNTNITLVLCITHKTTIFNLIIIYVAIIYIYIFTSGIINLIKYHNFINNMTFM